MATERGERLQKYLARAGVASRRRVEVLMLAGQVTVNGREVRELGTRVIPGLDQVRVRGRLVRPADEGERLYLMLHKPPNTVTTARDPQSRRTVLDLLPPEWRARRVYPVGRLDRDTEGLLLLTDDGDLALRLAHPRYALSKQYHVRVAGRPSRQALAQLRSGILLPSEARPTAPARIRVLLSADTETELSIELHEGRKRQVRRMCEAVGHPVMALRRVRIGPLTLGDLAPGACRQLTSAEVGELRRLVSLK